MSEGESRPRYCTLTTLGFGRQEWVTFVTVPYPFSQLFVVRWWQRCCRGYPGLSQWLSCDEQVIRLVGTTDAVFNPQLIH